MFLKILFFLFLGYLIYAIIRAVLVLRAASRVHREMQGEGSPRGGRRSFRGRKEKDISGVARVVEEKRLDEEEQ